MTDYVPTTYEQIAERSILRALEPAPMRRSSLMGKFGKSERQREAYRAVLASLIERGVVVARKVPGQTILSLAQDHAAA